jgi:hypothetical protein
MFQHFSGITVIDTPPPISEVAEAQDEWAYRADRGDTQIGRHVGETWARLGGVKQDLRLVLMLRPVGGERACPAIHGGEDTRSVRDRGSHVTVVGLSSGV